MFIIKTNIYFLIYNKVSVQIGEEKIELGQLAIRRGLIK